MPVPLRSREHPDRESIFYLTTVFSWLINILYCSLQNCASLSCTCETGNGSELQQCMTCLVDAEPTVQSTAQSALDSWNEACNGDLTVSRAFSLYIVCRAHVSSSQC